MKNVVRNRLVPLIFLVNINANKKAKKLIVRTETTVNFVVNHKEFTNVLSVKIAI